jgi:hypothetical protein
MLAPSLDELAFRMKVGDVSDVVHAKQGFVILKVTERSAAKSPEPAAIDPKPLAQLQVPAKPNPFKLSGTMKPGEAIQQATRDAATRRGGVGQAGEFGLGTGALGRQMGARTQVYLVTQSLAIRNHRQRSVQKRTPSPKT